MTYTTNAARYLREGGGANDETDNFFYFCSTFKKGGKKAHYEVYKLWARLLRHRRTLYKKHRRSDFHNDLTWYLGNVKKGELVDDELHQILLLSTQRVLLNLFSDT